MKIKGTGKSETLNGSSGTDIINGGAGDDIINGGVGNDTLTGGRGADTFVFGERSGFDVITDFNAAEGDRIVFDLGSGDQLALSGPLYDGMRISVGGTDCSVGCLDINGDGIMDTQISYGGSNIVLLGYTPDQVDSASLLFG